MALTAAARRSFASTALATLLATVVLLTLLGHARLTDWDEGIYAGISRAMLSTGWLVPHWNGQPWLEKPPLELWLTSLNFRIFGVTEFAARLTSALSGVALVTLLHAWLTLRRNALTAWLNTLILLSTFGFQHVARVGEMDVLLSLACTLAVIGLCELQRAEDRGRGWLLFGTGFAIALMTKGAASLTLPLTFVLGFALRRLFARSSALLAVVPGRNLRSDDQRQRYPFKRTALVKKIALALFLALTLPWHLAMLHRFGDTFTAQYLGLHVLTRATSQIEGHITPWYFYLRVLLVSAAPWVFLYPFALYNALRQRHQDSLAGHDTTLRPFALFALTVLTLFSIAQTRLPHYIAPAYPALAVLTAAWIAARLGPWLVVPHPLPRLLKCIAATLALYTVAALLTANSRKSPHAPHLPNGDTTPDNREQIALLKQVFQHPQPGVTNIAGPLLTLRSGSYNPIPTTVFYSGRQVQQTILTPNLPVPKTDKYTNDPILLTLALADHQPHLLLANRSLLSTLPRSIRFQPLAERTTLALGIASTQ
jgi:4-amino-4-deoxy-L-arabinose transferase-like glycosyltransferase